MSHATQQAPAIGVKPVLGLKGVEAQEVQMSSRFQAVKFGHSSQTNTDCLHGIYDNQLERRREFEVYGSKHKAERRAADLNRSGADYQPVTPPALRYQEFGKSQKRRSP